MCVFFPVCVCEGVCLCVSSSRMACDACKASYMCSAFEGWGSGFFILGALHIQYQEKKNHFDLYLILVTLRTAAVGSKWKI